MFKVAIIGAGQIGSRHLQGLSYSNSDLEIFVCDRNPDSIEMSRKRWLEADGPNKKHSINYIQSTNDLPAQIDVLIVATDSFSRRKVIEDFLSVSICKHMLIEKVLFPRKEDYYPIDKLLEEKKINAYVNCPRRLYPGYAKMQNMFKGDADFAMSVTGNWWGLGCNAIHFIDLFSFLGAATTGLSFNTSQLDKIIHPSKRENYIEFTGTLVGTTANGSTLSLTSLNKKDQPPGFHLKLSSSTKNITIVENPLQMNMSISSNNTELPDNNPILPQSKLTGPVIDNLISGLPCKLPNYKESMNLHLPMLSGFTEFISSISGEKTEICLIT